MVKKNLKGGYNVSMPSEYYGNSSGRYYESGSPELGTQKNYNNFPNINDNLIHKPTSLKNLKRLLGSLWGFVRSIGHVPKP